MNSNPSLVLAKVSPLLVVSLRVVVLVVKEVVSQEEMPQRQEMTVVDQQVHP